MEKVKGVFVAKLTAIVAIIFTMLFSSFAPITSWAEEVLDASGNVTESDYVSFNLDWTATEVNAGAYSPNFSLQLNTLEEFKEFRIEVTGNNKASIFFRNEGEYFGTTSYSTTKSIQYLKTIPGGTRITGSVSIDFPKADDYRDYTESIKVTLYGTYEKDGTTYNVKMEKSIDVTVHTPEKVSTPYFYNNFKRESHTVTTSSNTPTLYKVSWINDKYNLYIQHRNASNIKLNFDFHRVGTNNEVTYYPWSLRVTKSGTTVSTTRVTNTDGTISYVIDGISSTPDLEENYV